jgi:hypothetical protein
MWTKESFADFMRSLAALDSAYLQLFEVHAEQARGLIRSGADIEYIRHDGAVQVLCV